MGGIMKKALALMLVLVALTGSTGCGGGDDNPLGPSDVSGTYGLASAKVTTGGIEVTVTPPRVTGNLVLNPDSRFSVDISFDGDAISIRGSYTVEEPNVVLRAEDGSQAVGTLSNGNRTITITLVDPEATVIYTFTR